MLENLARTKNRVLAGGHDVPEGDVRRRYQRSFKNLLSGANRADHTILFDNSTEEGYRLVAVLGPSERFWFEPIPIWAAATRQISDSREPWRLIKRGPFLRLLGEPAGSILKKSTAGLRRMSPLFTPDPSDNSLKCLLVFAKTQ